jgi:hypothetical protein
MVNQNMEGKTEDLGESSHTSETSEVSLLETEKNLEQEVHNIKDNNKALKNLIIELNKNKSISSISEA